MQEAATVARSREAYRAGYCQFASKDFLDQTVRMNWRQEQPRKQEEAGLPNRIIPANLIAAMNNRTGMLILAVVALGLGIALIAVRVQSSKQHDDDTTSIGDFSNKLDQAQATIKDKQKDAEQKQKDYEEKLNQKEAAFLELTNKFQKTAADLQRTATDLQRTTADLSTKAQELATTQESLKQEKTEVAKRDTRISELVKQNQDLDKQALELGTAITNLNLQIADTERKLRETKQDNSELSTQLQHLMAERNELQRQFNDVDVVRAQLSKLKHDIVVTRRIEWIRDGVYTSAEEKGAQKLMKGFTPPPASASSPKPKNPSNYDLNVEVNADGSVKIIPPLTNAPARR
jgi:hypothetical protein